MPISRPAPSFSIDGDLDICSGFKTYTLGGLPSGATVSWSLPSNPYASIPNPSTGATVNVTHLGATGSVTLTATVSDCVTTYPSITKTIYLGSLPLSLYSLPGAATVYANAGYYYSLRYPYQIPIPNNIYWRVPNGWSIVWGQGTANISVETGNEGGVVQVDFDDNCRVSTGIFKNVTIGSGGPSPLRSVTPITSDIEIYPNPSTGKFTITLKTNDKSISIKELRVKNKMGAVVYHQKFKESLKQQTIYLNNQQPDIYIVEIFDGTYWITQKLSLQRQ